jgi:ATP-dependent Clp protease ATP-binding subunit ClpA
MFERFTRAAREVVVGAQHQARQLGHPVVGTEHLLLGLAADPGVAGRVLAAAGLDPTTVRAGIAALLDAPPRLVSDEDAAALRSIGIDVAAVQDRVERVFSADVLGRSGRPRGRFRRRGPGGGFSRRAKKVLELSLREAIRLHDREIATEHILLGLLREGGGLAAQVITGAGVRIDDLRAATLAARNRAA